MAGRRLALIVATDEYHDPGLKQLRAPGTDAEALAAVLRDPERGEFEVDIVRNERARPSPSGSRPSSHPASRTT